ncbi:3',5'-cyclic-nucleotide phosphodiesterase [Lactobacillus nasalidis]|uniref:3',5'-cyclic-nucleotide phosphodiesterase n=1 Tax=Lactobacillus nasalidis TaxID=2797258 RepID=A0ABQ3W611_9LACO|nr:metallophosphoesterase [Lactobacillus nasalidis]GHV97740.1 3',5'-cyclic-nucleotide phosphodiesterase [Lactobacillus nasalidis]GHV98946.1 3',5'-cyclic-nucleotide phosphodiesterase [Lactobacillus nasalidis]GHW01144.1 3',5'-cyclic-nucleotide phosphodiesterase [Lactobacillus nasalidis]
MKKITGEQAAEFWLISDPHLIADDLHDQGPRFQEMRLTSAGKDIAYQDLALRAFVRKVVRQRPAALIITGDLTFNGAKRSAERLAEIFAPLKAAGVALLVIPGNHDIYDGWARSFEGSEDRRTEQISPAAWKKIFSGSYDLAISQDPASLSYSVCLNDRWRLLLLDSNLYGSQYSYMHPVTSGAIDDGEKRWLKQELDRALEAGQELLFFMHHNLYSHNSVVHDGFKLNNAGEIVQLLSRYPVRCAFSGHIHAQHVMSGWVPVPEVVSSCFAESDQGYGIVRLEARKLHYERRSFDINNYLTAEEKQLWPFDNFHAYLKDVFDQSNDLLIRQHILRRDAAGQEAAVRLLKSLHWDFFTGNSYKSPEEIAAIQSSSAYQDLISLMPDMKAYLASLCESTQSSLELKLSW